MQTSGTLIRKLRGICIALCVLTILGIQSRLDASWVSRSFSTISPPVVCCEQQMEHAPLHSCEKLTLPVYAEFASLFVAGQADSLSGQS